MPSVYIVMYEKKSTPGETLFMFAQRGYRYLDTTYRFYWPYGKGGGSRARKYCMPGGRLDSAPNRLQKATEECLEETGLAMTSYSATTTSASIEFSTSDRNAHFFFFDVTDLKLSIGELANRANENIAMTRAELSTTVKGEFEKCVKPATKVWAQSNQTEPLHSYQLESRERNNETMFKVINELDLPVKDDELSGCFVDEIANAYRYFGRDPNDQTYGWYVQAIDHLRDYLRRLQEAS